MHVSLLLVEHKHFENQFSALFTVPRTVNSAGQVYSKYLLNEWIIRLDLLLLKSEFVNPNTYQLIFFLQNLYYYVNDFLK